MPFRSEKQRRFLWAAHPDIAKRWAHEYPKSNKNLPMYASDKDKKDEAKAMKKDTEKASAPNTVMRVPQNLPENFMAIVKKAASKAIKVTLPQSDEPVAAGDKSILTSEKDQNEVTKPKTHESDEKTAKSVLNKLGAVLGEKLMQEIADQEAAAMGTEAPPVPQNVGLKSYAMPAQATPLPMGMQQAQAAPQAPAAPAQPQAPVAPQAPKMASAGTGAAIQAIKPMYSMSQQRRIQAQQEAQRQQGRKQPQYAPVGGGSNPNSNPINAYGGLSTDPSQYGTPNAAFGTANSAEKMSAAQAIAKWAAAKPTTACSCGCGDTVATCKCGPDCKCRKPGGSCYKGKDSDSEKKAGTPAWQRSAGKNEEGGLNAKGRASYNKATGGNLKPPVTESNPTGERKSRRASFCARMGGMKKKLTGKDTANDPDSRINKALRKWNCKSSSEKEANVGSRLGLLGRLFGGAAKPAVNMAQQVVKKTPALDLHTAHPSVVGPLAYARGIPLINEPELMQKAWNWSQQKRFTPRPPATRPRAQFGRWFGDTMEEQRALIPARQRYEQVMHERGLLPQSHMQGATDPDWFAKTPPAPSWAALKGILPQR